MLVVHKTFLNAWKKNKLNIIFVTLYSAANAWKPAIKILSVNDPYSQH